jgi:hypothetical protein
VVCVGHGDAGGAGAVDIAEIIGGLGVLVGIAAGQRLLAGLV